MINSTCGAPSALDSSFNVKILAVLKMLNLTNSKGTFTLKNRKNKEEIEGVRKGNLQNSRLRKI